MAHDLFISHSTKNKEVANALRERAEKAGIRCWIAPRDIDPGKTWDEAIVQAIAAATAVVLVFSKAANASDVVCNEIALAARGRKRIIPFRIEDVPLSDALALHLSRVHWIDALVPPLEPHIDRLVEIFNGTPQPVQTGTAQPARVQPDNQDKLAYLAKYDSNEGIRIAAIAKLTDQPTLSYLAKYDINERTRKAAIAKLTDQDTLGYIAKHDLSKPIRIAALAKVTDQETLGYLAKYDLDEAVRMAALDRLES